MSHNRQGLDQLRVSNWLQSMSRWSIILSHSQADIRRKARRTEHHGVLSKRKGQQIKDTRHFGRREVDDPVAGDLVYSQMCALCEHSCSIEI